jgi:hypothetical protein
MSVETIPRDLTLLRQIVYTPNGGVWVVGSAALPGADLRTVRDWDVVVSLQTWTSLTPLIVAGADKVSPNTFGGWKVHANGVSIDVWPDEIGRLAVLPHFRAAWNPRMGVRLMPERSSPST